MRTGTRATPSPRHATDRSTIRRGVAGNRFDKSTLSFAEALPRPRDGLNGTRAYIDLVPASSEAEHGTTIIRVPRRSQVRSTSDG